jgi:predicted metalloprotease
VLLGLSAAFLAIIAAALVVVPLTGIAGPRGPVTAGAALAADRIDSPPTGGVAVRRVPDRPTGPRSGVENAAVAAIIDDLDSYWAQMVPQIAGTSFVPLRGGVIAIDSAAPAPSGAIPNGTVAPCVNAPEAISGNAFYCPDDDGIVFDSSALVPVLLGHYGSAGLVAAFAHEFGHAIQARIGPTAKDRAASPASFPSLLIEGQGDCYAGAFLAWVVAGHAASIHLSDDAMLAAIGPLVDFRDPVTVAADDSTAHGWGLDRLNSILVGYRDGAPACHAMTVASQHAIQGTVGIPAGPDASMTTPRYPSTAAALAAARVSVSAFAGAPATVTPDPADLAAAAPYGQFADATALALAVGRERAGADPAIVTDAQIAVSAACFAGSWAASVYGHAPGGALGAWPGDADEGLDLVRSRPGATFADAAGYADGFRSGAASCG